MPGILLAIGYASLFLYLIHRSRFFRVDGVPDRWVLAVFVLKVMAGTALWALYTYVIVDRPNADIYRYFDDSAVMYSALKTSPGDYLRMLTGIDCLSLYVEWFAHGYLAIFFTTATRRRGECCLYTSHCDTA